jgi:transposase
MDATGVIKKKFQALSGHLDEATLRRWAAVEAQTLGHGGVSTVAKAIGISRTTIYAGLKELDRPVSPSESKEDGTRRVRAKGGGRKKLTEKDSTLLKDLDALVEPTARGDPQSPLRWTCKSTPRLAKELTQQGHTVSQRSVCDLLAQLDYSLQATRKTREGGTHPDRDAQFSHIATMAAQYQAAGDPVISVDTKKKELIGDFKNRGVEWQPKGSPEEVRVYDFIDPKLGKIAPYGVYDLATNQGWV